MKQINNSIIFLLSIMVIGFFANFAQNDYGMFLVVICCLCLSFLFFSKTYLLVHKPFFKLLLLIPLLSLLLCFIMQFFFRASNDSLMHVNHVFFLVVYVCASICLMLFSLLIIPLSIFISERKKVSKTIDLQYFETVFLGLFSFSIYLKSSHLMGASVILVLSGLVLVPYIFVIIRMLVYIWKEKNFSLINTINLYLFVCLIFVAYIFKSQHWPGAKNLVDLSFFQLIVLLIWSTISHFTISPFKSWWPNLSFMSRLMGICFLITSCYMMLRKNDIAPNIYSNELPKAFQELKGQANNISLEGKKYAKLSSIYENEYDQFIHEQLSNNK